MLAIVPCVFNGVDRSLNRLRPASAGRPAIGAQMRDAASGCQPVTG